MRQATLSILMCSLLWGCSLSDSSDDDASGNEGANEGNGADADGIDGVNGDAVGDVGITDPNEEICKSVSANTQIGDAYLVFAFDVSGSMGKGDYPWHDETLKWEPISAATRAFLEDPASAGFFASMTFFPASDDKCEDESYAAPDVPMTPLPSTEFGEAMDDIAADDWRGGTPTLHVVRGTLDYIRDAYAAAPGRYAMVLVTDGYPQGCDDNNIDAVANEAADGAAEGFSTYVIGVNNPPISGAPDTVSNLTQVAEAGGTERAFIIDTGDPVKTTDDFTTVINNIRSATFSCSVNIPPVPDDRPFDKKKVRIIYTSGAEQTELVYDPTCGAADSWRYDNFDHPTRIELCEETCNTIRNDPDAQILVEFACADEPDDTDNADDTDDTDDTDDNNGTDGPIV